MGELLKFIGGITLDITLKLLRIKTPWGFYYDNHPFASLVTGGLFILVLIHTYNFGISKVFSIYLGLFGAIIFVLYFTNFDFKPAKKTSDLLDDDLT